MTQAEKIEKGIDLIYSPDRSSYYVPDNPYEFNSLVLGGKNEKTIFEYTEFFGSVFREFNEATVFWGGLSDGLYLVWRSGENLSGGIKLWFYDLQDEKWNEVDVSFLPQERIHLVATVDHTPFLVFEEWDEVGNKTFHLVDVDKKSIKPIDLPNHTQIVDQYNGLLLISEPVKKYQENSEFSLSIYDVQKGTISSLPLSVPYYGDTHVRFIHDSDYISYPTSIMNGNLVIFDSKTNQTLVIPTDQNQWNADFSCLYNDESISCIESERMNK